MSQYKTHAVININSKDKNSGSIEDFRIELASSINLRKNVRYFVRAENVKLPVAFHQINSNFNSFTWQETNGITPLQLEVVLAEGSYTILELVAQLEIDMNAESTLNGYDATYTIDYTTFDNTVNIAAVVGTGTMTIMTITSDDGAGTDNTLAVSLGYLADGTETIAVSANLDAPNGASTQRIKNVNIFTRLPISNYYNKVGLQKILYQIPITETRYQFQYNPNSTGHMLMINSENVNEIFSTLRDEDNNIIDMRGAEYSYQLVFYREKSMSSKLLKFFKSKSKN